ncbi:MAG: AGE family epimerase/isomerase [Zavarzinia sp.]|nr:AGE family epimerase/isomerase [Zavarzinia sp.]
MSGMQELISEFEVIKAWLFEAALPLWSTTAVDFEKGGFFERLAIDGSVIEEPRRARVTGRQIYAFAIAERLGWAGPTRDLIRHGLVSLERFIGPKGFVIRLLDAEGRVLDDAFDLYDHAFILFGLAAAAGVGEQPAHLEGVAEALRGRIQAEFAHPKAGFEEGNPRILPLKANPHMHMLEACLAWEAISDDPAWGALADEIAELCLSSFIEPVTGALREYFDGDWRRVETAPDDVVEPGHQFEWAWLLMRWGRSRGRHDAVAAGVRLILVGEGPGVDAARGLALNELNGDLTVRDTLCRLWPQTERIKAHCLAMTEARSEAAAAHAAERAAVAIRGLRRYFEHPVPGAWHEHIGPDGRPLEAPSRTSSLYHIICAINEVADQLGVAMAPPRLRVS